MLRARGRGGWTARAALAAAGLAALAAAIALAVTIGEIAIPFETAAKAVCNRVLGCGYPLNRLHESVIFEYRLSRALVAALGGASLALCGAVLQALLRNPLAEPYVLGISAGASTGAVAVLVLGLGGSALTLPVGAFAGAVTAFALVMLLAAGTGGASDRTILAGVAGAQLFNALTSYVVTTSASAEQVRGVMFWLLGSLAGVRWPDVRLAAAVALVGFAACLAAARSLDAFAFGDDAAASLGVPVMRTRLALFALAALVTATMVSVVGAVGFVGLVIPHAARFLVGPAHGRLLPACLIGGAVFMVAADLVARTLVPGQVLPIGVVTALFGAPAFALILYRARRPG